MGLGAHCSYTHLGGGEGVTITLYACNFLLGGGENIHFLDIFVYENVEIFFPYFSIFQGGYESDGDSDLEAELNQSKR